MSEPIAPPHGLSEIISVYGDPKFSGAPDASVDPHWESASMTLLRQLPGGIPKLYVHRLIVDPLIKALSAAVATGWVPTSAACFSPRCKRGLKWVSVHTWGIAVDFDPDQNKLIAPCPVGDPRRDDPANKTIPDGVIDIFRSIGWTWGGDFATRYDPMHFQFCSGY